MTPFLNFNVKTISGEYLDFHFISRVISIPLMLCYYCASDDVVTWSWTWRLKIEVEDCGSQGCHSKALYNEVMIDSYSINNNFMFPCSPILSAEVVQWNPQGKLKSHPDLKRENVLPCECYIEYWQYWREGWSWQWAPGSSEENI